ncbi:HPr family phosphocarrier protein [Calorimonas adulescens]|jgi:Phosphotransferase System HPr (HPr) Family|uniref:HPr family phosphocarrier protein n=1 Tax=Calorimonas adulescens TaxID=2606906 RepID=A0A5D8QI49_9THEO|nr:HPr family phosphocarrier protein [Calorimonas adulescens]TZE82988.1 HPr family phosphocarrier protein [Calorimonas adulescens]
MVKKITYQVKNPQGIHARPAGMLVNRVSQFKCKVVIEKEKETVNAKEIFALMSLSVKQGDIITITFDGEEEETAVKAIEEFIKENL